jgi:hypothetical protein
MEAISSFLTSTVWTIHETRWKNHTRLLNNGSISILWGRGESAELCWETDSLGGSCHSTQDRVDWIMCSPGTSSLSKDLGGATPLSHSNGSVFKPRSDKFTNFLPTDWQFNCEASPWYVIMFVIYGSRLRGCGCVQGRSHFPWFQMADSECSLPGKKLQEIYTLTIRIYDTKIMNAYCFVPTPHFVFINAVLRRMTPALTFRHFIFDIRFNIVLPDTARFLQWFLPLNC